MTNPPEEQPDQIVQEPEQVSAFNDGKWYKLGSSATANKLGTFGLNEIFTVSAAEANADQVVLTNIMGKQTTVHKSLLKVLEQKDTYELVPINIGDKFRIPKEEKLEEMGFDLPAHIKERINPGAVLKVVRICNKGSMIEVSLWNGNSFLICPEILSKFRRKSEHGK
jgi:hypothetical protein